MDGDLLDGEALAEVDYGDMMFSDPDDSVGGYDFTSDVEEEEDDDSLFTVD